MAQSQSTLQQAFTEVQKTVGKVVETPAGLQKSLTDVQQVVVALVLERKASACRCGRSLGGTTENAIC